MVHGLASCAHCGALLNGPICAICGKSERDDVEVVAAEAPKRRGFSPELRSHVVKIAATVAGAALIATVGYAVLSRESVEPTPAALAAPTPTSSTTTVPAPTVQPPTIERPDEIPPPSPAVEVGAERTVTPSDGANPWNGAPPSNVLSGEPLDNTDYAPGIAAVAARLAELPAAFTVAAPGQRTEWNGVDLGAAESSQPFAARSISGADGVIADIWIVARGGSTTDGSAAFFAQAAATWPSEAPLDTFSPRPGVRLLQLSDDGAETVWLDLRDEWLALYRAPSGTDPALLGAISDGWS